MAASVTQRLCARPMRDRGRTRWYVTCAGRCTPPSAARLAACDRPELFPDVVGERVDLVDKGRKRVQDDAFHRVARRRHVHRGGGTACGLRTVRRTRGSAPFSSLRAFSTIACLKPTSAASAPTVACEPDTEKLFCTRKRHARPAGGRRRSDLVVPKVANCEHTEWYSYWRAAPHAPSGLPE